MATQYGIIKKRFQHEPCSVYEGRVIVQVEWLVNVSKCPLTFIQTVRRNSLNPDMEFIFLDSCYQQPVAMWPHDPLNLLDVDDEEKDFFDIIDRNQLQQF